MVVVVFLFFKKDCWNNSEIHLRKQLPPNVKDDHIDDDSSEHFKGKNFARNNLWHHISLDVSNNLDFVDKRRAKLTIRLFMQHISNSCWPK